MISPERFAELNGLSFRDAGLLVQALTHPSYVNEALADTDARDNQRLEYLGDAVLDLIVADELFARFTESDEGDLTQIRSLLVSAELLAVLASDCQLGEALRLGKGSERTGLRASKNVLADAFEAVVGALYVDAGFEGARAFALPLLLNRLEQAVSEAQINQSRSALQERAQGAFGITPHYRVIGETGMPHERIYTTEVLIGERVAGIGSGHGKNAAATAAAANALSKWDDLFADELR